jgi:hypothetical protein
MESGIHFEEKRDFIRVKMDSTVSITLQDAPGETHTARCIDLSGAGMQLETSKRLSAGSALRVSVRSPTADIPPLNAHGRVIWSKQKEGSSLYKCGIYLERME